MTLSDVHICVILPLPSGPLRHLKTSLHSLSFQLHVCLKAPVWNSGFQFQKVVVILRYLRTGTEQFYCLYGIEMSVQRNTLASAWYFLVHANVSVTAHTASIWITVTLSAFRYSMVRRAADGRAATATSTENDLRKSRYIVVLVCASCAVVLIPNYLTLAIARSTDPATNQTMYELVTTSSQPNSTAADVALSTVNFWIHALVIKLVPCVLMSLFGFLLVLTVRRQRQRSRQLLRGTGAKIRPRTAVKCQSKSKAREGHHTTAMLVSVIVLFLITEFPQGVLALD